MHYLISLKHRLIHIYPRPYWLIIPSYHLIFQVNELIIDTIDTVRQRYLLEKLVLNDKPILFVGPTGTGKSAITNNFLFQLPRDKFIVSNVNFSARTTSNQTQDFIFSKLERSVSIWEVIRLTFTRVAAPSSRDLSGESCQNTHDYKIKNIQVTKDSNYVRHLCFLEIMTWWI